MWDLPRPGLEPVSPALAGRFTTTVPPGKPVQLILRSECLYFKIIDIFLREVLVKSPEKYSTLFDKINRIIYTWNKNV